MTEDAVNDVIRGFAPRPHGSLDVVRQLHRSFDVIRGFAPRPHGSSEVELLIRIVTGVIRGFAPRPHGSEVVGHVRHGCSPGDPRLRAAASLKLQGLGARSLRLATGSAASRRGLIEAK